MPTADSPNPYMWETTDNTAYAILIRKTNNYSVHEVETYCIIFCAVNFSQQKRAKHGHGLLVRVATPEYPAFTLIILILLAQIGTWRRVLFSLPKGAGHGHSLVTGAVFRPENQELEY